MLSVKERTFEAELCHIHVLHEAASITDAGKLRDNNEDDFGTLQFSISQGQSEVAIGLFVVADGMGGHQAGEVAAGIAVSSMVQAIASRLPGPAIGVHEEVLLRKMLEDSVRQAHQNIVSAGSDKNGMGTTLVAALVVDNMAYIANVGDSRAYMFDGKELRQITSDHSLVWQLASFGHIKKEDTYSHPQRNVLLRALGLSGELEIDLFSERLERGYEMLLCSNGLWEMVRDKEIEGVLRQDLAPLHKAHRLIDMANANGGVDNITVVILKATQP